MELGMEWFAVTESTYNTITSAFGEEWGYYDPDTDTYYLNLQDLEVMEYITFSDDYSYFYINTQPSQQYGIIPA